MLEFGEKAKPEILEGLMSTYQYSDIKPEKETNDSSKNFWDDVFADNESEEKESVNEEDLYNDIFGVSEEDFVFDFDFFDPKILQLLELFNNSMWDEKTDEEKIAIIKEFIKVVGEKLGLDKLPVLELFDGEPFECGAFNAGENVLKVNKELLNNPAELINTLAHELRHAYQNMRAMSVETYTDFLYLVNFINYITPEMGFTDYEDQLVEAEARAFANMFNQKGEMA